MAKAFERAADPSTRNGSAIKARADAMKARHGEEWKELQAAYKSEREKIWNERRDFKTITAQHRVETRPLWSAFGKEQAAERREWQRNERTTLGVIDNALKAVASQQIGKDRDKGYLSAVFRHCVSKERRDAAFEKMQAKAKADFIERIDAPLKSTLAAEKAGTAARMNVARANYATRKTALKEKQAGERGQIRETWKTYFAFRNAVTDWRTRSATRSAAPRRSSPARSTVPAQAAQGAQSVSELREAYGGGKRERNRDRDRTHSRRKERFRSRTRTDDKKPDPS